MGWKWITAVRYTATDASTESWGTSNARSVKRLTTDMSDGGHKTIEFASSGQPPFARWNGSENWRAYGVKMSHGAATTLVATEGRETSPAMGAVAVIGKHRPANSPNDKLSHGGDNEQ